MPKTSTPTPPSAARKRTRATASPAAPDAAADAFTRLCEVLAGEGGVDAPGAATGKRGFGSRALKVNGKIFAMLTKPGFVVRLPRERVEALVTQGIGIPFDPGHGRLMREWLTVRAPPTRWLPLAREARDSLRNTKA